MSLNAQPNNKVVKLRYSDTVSLDPGILKAPQGLAFRANSIFDPDYSGAGHQPMGHDQLGAFYNHYTVLGAKFTFRMSSYNSAGPIICGVILDDDATAPSNINALIEQGRGYTTLIDQKGGKGISKLVARYSAKRFHGVTDVKDNIQLKATFGNNPAEGAYWVIWAACLDGTDPSALQGQVTIDYIVQLSEPKDLTQS